jgi:2-succinyl-5-enolpyruvyl-6-hydroxy-3-cyclohexene-1-carboxylate synthase
MDERQAAASSQSDTGQRGILHAVKDRATSELKDQKGRATDVVDVLAHAVRQTTDQLREEHHDTIARYVDRAADQLERFSGRMRDKNMGELMHDVRDLARRQPTLFIGGSFVAGLLVARFLKSSREDGYDGDRGYGRRETAGWREPAAFGSTGDAPPAGGY